LFSVLAFWLRYIEKVSKIYKRVKNIYSMHTQDYGIPAFLKHFPSFIILDNLRN
jgi:hypothetical protein